MPDIRITIVNAARQRIGASPLISETAKGADRDLAIYDGVVGSILSSYPWTFSTPTRKLDRLVPPAPIEYKYLYLLPPDMDGSPRAVYSDRDARVPVTDFRLTVETIDGQQRKCLATDAETVWLTFTATIDPSFWPGNVREVVIQALMAEFALTLREDANLAVKLREIVYGPPSMQGDGGLVAQARALDSSARASSVLARGVSPLIAVRR